MRRSILLLVLFAAGAAGAEPGARAEYIGGTIAALQGKPEGTIRTTDEQLFLFVTRTMALRIPYNRINLLEYGQKVDRRYAMAFIVSPIFLLSKSRRHFLTVGYSDDEGRQQAIVFRVDKNAVRSVLASLEARTGRKVEYQDQEARKAGKG